MSHFFYFIKSPFKRIRVYVSHFFIFPLHYLFCYPIRSKKSWSNTQAVTRILSQFSHNKTCSSTSNQKQRSASQPCKPNSTVVNLSSPLTQPTSRRRSQQQDRNRSFSPNPKQNVKEVVFLSFKFQI